MTFLADCPRCGRRELRGSRGVHVTHTNEGDVFALTCRSCGTKLAAGTNRVVGASPMHAVA
ncbi:MAG TPA: hypothetical protein VIR58_17045 [Acidimicrobiales bacterium]